MQTKMKIDSYFQNTGEVRVKYLPFIRSKYSLRNTARKKGRKKERLSFNVTIHILLFLNA